MAHGSRIEVGAALPSQFPLVLGSFGRGFWLLMVKPECRFFGLSGSFLLGWFLFGALLSRPHTQPRRGTPDQLVWRSGGNGQRISCQVRMTHFLARRQSGEPLIHVSDLMCPGSVAPCVGFCGQYALLWAEERTPSLQTPIIPQRSKYLSGSVAFCSPAKSLAKPTSWQQVKVLTSKQHAPL